VAEAMKLIAQLTTKLSDPIYNAHRDPRKVVYYLCKLYIKPAHGPLRKDAEPIAESGIWSHTEKGAIDSALTALTRIDHVVKRDYNRLDYEWASEADAWGQVHVRDSEDKEHIHKLFEDTEFADAS
jgi:hypothetical protein